MKEQDELLELITSKYMISPEVIAAYKNCPRHLFLKRTYSLEEIYQDYPLEIYRDENFISTISQPSFVLLMIDMLSLRPHHKVLELGTGSGWNAALMSTLCKLVVSIEIIPHLAQETRANLLRLGFKNIIVKEGDGADGCTEYAPYDRGIFTAGATDLPLAFHEQIVTGGLLLFVFQTEVGDLLILLKKERDYFEELRRVPCSFVPMKGKKGGGKSSLVSSFTTLRGKIRIYPNSHGEDHDSVISVS